MKNKFFGIFIALAMLVQPYNAQSTDPIKQEKGSKILTTHRIIIVGGVALLIVGIPRLPRLILSDSSCCATD